MAARYHPGSTRSRALRRSPSSSSSESDRDLQRNRPGRRHHGVTQPIVGQPSTTSIYGTPVAVHTYEHKPTIRPKRSLDPEETSIVSNISQPATCVDVCLAAHPPL